MTWVRLDDVWPEHPKMIAVGPLGREFYARALCYASRNQTDGFLPARVAGEFGGYGELFLRDEGTIPGCPPIFEPVRVAGVVRSLTDAGALELVDGGFEIHDYLEYQLSTADRHADRERWREQKKRAKSRVLNNSTPVSVYVDSETAVDARARGVTCAECGIEITSTARLTEHLENVHGVYEGFN